MDAARSNARPDARRDAILAQAGAPAQPDAHATAPPPATATLIYALDAGRVTAAWLDGAAIPVGTRKTVVAAGPHTLRIALVGGGETSASMTLPAGGRTNCKLVGDALRC